MTIALWVAITVALWLVAGQVGNASEVRRWIRNINNKDSE